MTQKRRQGRHGNAIREMAALRWEPTHITKHSSRVVPLQVSKTQRTVALSSTEAEYIALSDCSDQCIWIYSILLELGFIQISTDN